MTHIALNNIEILQEKTFLQLTFRAVPVQNGMPGQLNSLSLQNGINRPSVLDVELHFQIVDDVGSSQFGVIDGLFQGKAFGVEGDQTVA